MKAIHKYAIKLRSGMPAKVNLPIGAIIRHIGQQADPDEVVLWAEVDPEAVRHETRRFRVHGTGYPMEAPFDRKFIGTVVSTISPYVWHVYEEQGPL